MKENNSNRPPQGKAKIVCIYIGLFMANLILFIVTGCFVDYFANKKKTSLEYWWLDAIGALVATVIIYFIYRRKNGDQKPD